MKSAEIHNAPSAIRKNEINKANRKQSFFGTAGHRPFFQPKLTVNTPGDVYEREADAVAEKVMRMPAMDQLTNKAPISISRMCDECSEEEKELERKEEPGIEAGASEKVFDHPNSLIQREENDEEEKELMLQRKCENCEEEQEEHNIARKAINEIIIQKSCPDCAEEEIPPKENNSNEVAYATDNVEQTLQSKGQPLGNDVRSFMEHRFGYDFSSVEIHNDALANQSSADIQALAYTHQNHIAFANGQYQPNTSSGKQLLAHELAHVVQQHGKTNMVQLQRGRDIDGDITIRWIDDDGEIYRKIVSAISKKFRVPESALFQPVYSNGMAVYQHFATKSLKKGAAIKLHVNFYYEKGEFIHSVKISLPVEVPASPKKETSKCPMLPAPSSAESRQDKYKEAQFYTRLFSSQVEDVDRRGDPGAVIHISYKGKEFSPGFETTKFGPAADPSRIIYSCYAIEREHMKPFFDGIMIAIESFKPGYIYSWDIEFLRDHRGKMQFVRSKGTYELEKPPAAGRSEADELKALGIPDRKAIYAGIFEEFNKQVKEAGIMVLTFGAEQLIYWYVGGIIFKGITIIGGAVGRTVFPRIAALLKLNNGSAAAVLSRGISALSKAEQTEFAALMRKVESGATLEAAETTSLNKILSKVEASLPFASKTGARGLLHLAERAGVSAEIEEGRIAVFLHGTSDEAAAKMIGDPGSFLTSAGGKFGGKFFAATDVSVAEHFAGRAVSGTASAPTVVGIALEQETVNALVKRKLVQIGAPIADRPGMLQVIFEPGAIETLNSEGFFFLVVP